MAKLNNLQRQEILDRRAKGETLNVIATAYGVSKAYVSQLAKKAKMSETIS